MVKAIAALIPRKWWQLRRIKWFFLNIKKFYYKHCGYAWGRTTYLSQAFLIPHQLNQNDPTNLIRDLVQTNKNQSFLLLDWDSGTYCNKAVKCTYICSRQIKLKNCFSVHNSVCNCSYTNDLFYGLRSELSPDEWRQLINSSKASFGLFCSIT